MSEKIYVTYTCKNSKCRKAFIDLDPNNNINDIPLKNRYCPECVKNGFKNSKLSKMSKEDVENLVILDFLEENMWNEGITNKRDISFIKKYFLNQVKQKRKNKERINKVALFNQAKEVLSYQDWKAED